MCKVDLSYWSLDHLKEQAGDQTGGPGGEWELKQISRWETGIYPDSISKRSQALKLQAEATHAN